MQDQILTKSLHGTSRFVEGIWDTSDQNMIITGPVPTLDLYNGQPNLANKWQKLSNLSIKMDKNSKIFHKNGLHHTRKWAFSLVSLNLNTASYSTYDENSPSSSLLNLADNLRQRYQCEVLMILKSCPKPDFLKCFVCFTLRLTPK